MDVSSETTCPKLNVLASEKASDNNTMSTLHNADECLMY